MSRVRRLLGSVSDVEMVPPMLLICKPLFLSISTFETPPKNDTDARHRHWPVCQPLCLWTGSMKGTISSFETLPSSLGTCKDSGRTGQRPPRVRQQTVWSTCLVI